jgi:hypothetical protein
MAFKADLRESKCEDKCWFGPTIRRVSQNLHIHRASSFQSRVCAQTSSLIPPQYKQRCTVSCHSRTAWTTQKDPAKGLNLWRMAPSVQLSPDCLSVQHMTRSVANRIRRKIGIGDAQRPSTHQLPAAIEWLTKTSWRMKRTLTRFHQVPNKHL